MRRDTELISSDEYDFLESVGVLEEDTPEEEWARALNFYRGSTAWHLHRIDDALEPIRRSFAAWQIRWAARMSRLLGWFSR